MFNPLSHVESQSTPETDPKNSDACDRFEDSSGCDYNNASSTNISNQIPSLETGNDVKSKAVPSSTDVCNDLKESKEKNKGPTSGSKAFQHVTTPDADMPTIKLSDTEQIDD